MVLCMDLLGSQLYGTADKAVTIGVRSKGFSQRIRYFKHIKANCPRETNNDLPPALVLISSIHSNTYFSYKLPAK